MQTATAQPQCDRVLTSFSTKGESREFMDTGRLVGAEPVHRQLRIRLHSRACPDTAPHGGQGSHSYVIGPGDTLEVFVWRNQELSQTVPVRPDGKISTPLVEDMVAVGKTPVQLARDMEK